MSEYQCFFFGSPNSFLGGGVSCRSAETFQADTDEAACLRADALCRIRQKNIEGFELWQACRLVYRYALKPDEGHAPKRPSNQDGGQIDEG